MSVIDGESTRVYNKTLNGLDTLGDTEVGDLTVTGDLLVEGASSLEDGLDMNSTKITQLANGTAATDAVNLSQLTSAVGDYLPLAGGTMTGEIDMGSDKIINLTDGSAAQDAVSKSQMDTAISTAGSAFLPLTGGTMTGEIDMGSDKIINLTDGTAAQDAVSKSQMDTAISTAGSAFLPLTGGTMTGEIDMGSDKIINLTDGTAAQDAVSKSQMDTAISASSLWTAGAGTIIYYNSGLVGINKTTPVARLHVKGTGDYDAAEQVALFEDTRGGGATPRSTGITSTGITGRYDFNGEAGLAINFTGYAGGNTQYRNVYFYDGRNNLTGTFTGQSGNLNINGLLTAGVGQVGSWTTNTSYATFCHSSNNNTSAAIYQYSDGTTFVNRASGKFLHFRENNVDNMVIKSGGNVGINDTNPDATLTVNGDIRCHDNASVRVGASSTDNIRLHHTSNQSYIDFNTGNLFLRAGSTNQLVINNDTRLFLGGSVADNNTKGIYWHNGGDYYAYGLYRASGAWTFPYVPLVLAFGTGVRIVSRNANYGYIGFSNDDGDTTHTSALLVKINTYDTGTSAQHAGEIKSGMNPMLVAAGNIGSTGGLTKVRNISGVTHSTTGTYTVTFARSRPTNTYVVNVSPNYFTGSNASAHTYTTGSFIVQTWAGTSTLLNMPFAFTVTDWE